jgi:hypothetical protein
MEQAQQVLQDDLSMLAVPLFLSGLRQGVGEHMHKYLFWLWLPLPGFDPLKWRDRLHYLLWAPGWSHDGPNKRARVLRKQ